MTDAFRRWCAVIQYPGLAPVLFGHATVDVRAKDHEIETALRGAIDGCLPPGWTLLTMMPGMLIFQAEEKEHR